MRVADVRHPVAHRLVDGLLQRLLAGVHRHHLRAEHLHAIHIQRLPLAIHRAHVDDALQPEHGGDRGRGDAVLARAGLGDDARLAHAPGQQDLADGVVDLVRAGVEQILALEINLRAAQFARQPLGKIQRRGPSAKLPQVIFEVRAGIPGPAARGNIPPPVPAADASASPAHTVRRRGRNGPGHRAIFRWQLCSSSNFHAKTQRRKGFISNHGGARVHTDAGKIINAFHFRRAAVVCVGNRLPSGHSPSRWPACWHNKSSSRQI